MNHYKEAIKIFRNANHEDILWLILQSNPGAIVNAVKPPPLVKSSVTFNGLTLKPDEYIKVVGLLKANLIIDGIKEIRKITNADLKSAKDFCDDIRTKLGIMPANTGVW